ncbi:ATP-binding protein [Aureimonas sp. SA4125]|uniref:EipB family protein n=1 Tax=Aureimonas sp. SA4125 TaxID=2826993 RepID=UPI001CC74138|nr:DUF1849 family protein [Aureimonas sp. SA4125]BDA84242.1 ATP-binding protein [Aureimonas sp. SA4125]
MRTDPTARPWILAAFLTLTVVGSTLPARAAQLVPHRAVYELSLTRKSFDLLGGIGRIAADVEIPACGRFDTDYRFVARFEREDKTVVTDQQTVSVEDVAAGTFDFTTKTFVDNAPEAVLRGRAVNGAKGTQVSIEEPERSKFDLPLSVFPSAHTVALIENAKAGERFVQTPFFDGDIEEDMMLTTTAIITPTKPEGSGSERAKTSTGEHVDGKLHGIASWRVTESYFDRHTDADGSGQPLYQTSYTLYENGISDDITIDNGDYAFAGSLSRLDLKPVPTCPPSP